MIERFRESGIRACETEVKLFGGANMFYGEEKRNAPRSVGKMNIETAVEHIQKNGYTLQNVDTGGRLGRKIVFYPHTGETWAKTLGTETAWKQY